MRVTVGSQFGANPYVGPRAFQRGETLYGRDRELRELLDLLIAERIVLLHSPSGAGKTSLIQAALIPELEKEDFHVLPVMRVSMEPPSPSPPAHKSTNRYVYSLLLSLEEAQSDGHRLPQAELASLSLSDYLDRYGASLARASDLVLVFDQFEEILTLDPVDRAAKAALFEQVGYGLRDGRRWALFSMREDHLAGLDPYVRAVPTRLSSTYRLELLGVRAAAEAIQEPARDQGVQFQAAAATRLVDDLRRVRVQRLDGTTDERPGPFVEPVQLQVVCRRLWDRLPPGTVQVVEADLETVGNVDSALAGYYADQVAAVVDETGIQERAIRDWFDSQLITEQGIRSQVLQGPQQSGGLDNEAIWPLVDAHLVRAEQRRGATWFELAHDRLIGPVEANNQAWREVHTSPLALAARAWIVADKDPEKLYRGNPLQEALARAKAEPNAFTELEQEFIQASAEAERAQSARRLRLLLGGAALLLLLFSVLSAWALNSAADARHQRATAEVALAWSEEMLAREAGLRAGVETAQAQAQLTAAVDQATRRAESDALAAGLEATLTTLPTVVDLTPAQLPTPAPTSPLATGTPTATSSPGPTLPPDLTATAFIAAEIAQATATGRAIEAQLAQVYATQTAEARCPAYPQGEFVGIWEQPEYNGRLGCPILISPIDGYWAEQPFENGQMYWIQLPDWFFVTIGQDRGTWHMIEQSEIPWAWDPGTSCDPDEAPGPGLSQPIRGFGGVWCFLDDVQAQIGFATAGETGVSGNLLQEFEHGFILRDSRGLVYMMFRDDNENTGSFVRE